MHLDAKGMLFTSSLGRIKSLYQGWPKCGPSKISCGPCVKFWMHKWSIFEQKNTLNWHQSCHTYRKTSQTKILWPAIQYLNEIWPVSKRVWPPLVYIVEIKVSFCHTFLHELKTNWPACNKKWRSEKLTTNLSQWLTSDKWVRALVIKQFGGTPSNSLLENKCEAQKLAVP